MGKKIIYGVIILFVLQIAACVSCQMFTYDLDGPEKSYFLWLKEGAKFEFVSTKNDTTIFTITKIEKKKREPQILPILGGGDFFHSRTFFYVHCKISGNTQSMKQENGLYIYREKYNSHRIGVYCPLGGGKKISLWRFRNIIRF